ncbi:unnamed protein product [Penicillium glandicola]
MLTAGRSLTSWIYQVSVLSALCHNALSNATSQPPPNGARADLPKTSVTTCPAKSTWQTEAELFHLPPCLETRWGPGYDMYLASASPDPSAAANDPVVNPSAVSSGTIEEKARAITDQNTEQDQDTDPLLDGASFLSFDDWKKQILAKVGQSAENVGGSRRAAAAGKEDRRQPTGISNALDSLGDDAEIELDFGGFGAETPEASPTAWDSHIRSREPGNADRRGDVDVHTRGALQRDASRRKDAGTTCKERFNYASFDCAATVLKTNPECKGSSSVLIENKDSYMLNECRAQNKFLILELCDDILVDTVVLANYEFFSSIFHTFRWKELGVYEARNTREVQAFAVENSLIWARYLRIEFLTHYGHEFFCPVSLIRVHGTTMMEEYKHDESSDRAEVEELEASEANRLLEDLETKPVEVPAEKFIPAVEYNIIVTEVCPNPLLEAVSPFAKHDDGDVCGINDGPSATPPSTPGTTAQASLSKNSSTAVVGGSPSMTNAGTPASPKAEDARKQGEPSKNVVTAADAASVSSESAQQDVTSETTGKAINSKEEYIPPPESTRPTNTQPPSANPTTQESFFKSVHKRLQMLESNSTLSLLYIEEQSRILRDAFSKVEKRQLTKTSTFLENLNVTVLNELREFREQYDHVWKSVALEFEHQRIQYHQELHSLSGQLGVLADELVFQKRVTVIQSIMVLCCFALALFSRGSGSNYMEFPAVQRMVARSYNLRSSSPIFASPSASPGSTRPTSYRESSSHRRNLSDSSDQDSAASPTAYSPPTPTSSTERDEEIDKVEEPASPESMSVPSLATPQPRPHSTPPVLNGRPMDVDAVAPADMDLGNDNPRSPEL